MSAAGSSGSAIIAPPPARAVVLALAAETLCAFDVADVVEIGAIPAMTRIPHAHPEVEGVVNVRGRVMPVVDLGAKLHDRRTEPASSARLVVVDTPTGVCGVIVDRALHITTLESWRPAPTDGCPAENLSRCVLHHPDGRILALIEPARLLPRADAWAEAA